jgi:hypothetical protein
MRTGPYEFVKEMVEHMLDSDQPIAQAQTWAAVVSGIVIGYLVTWNW